MSAGITGPWRGVAVAHAATIETALLHLPPPAQTRFAASVRLFPDARALLDELLAVAADLEKEASVSPWLQAELRRFQAERRAQQSRR